MKSIETKPGIGSQFPEHASVPVQHYEAFMWMVHTRDFPDDHVARQRKVDVEPTLARQQARSWATDDPITVQRALCGQLNLVLRTSLRALNAPINYDEALNSGQDVVMHRYLIDTIGPLAIRSITQDSLFEKNSTLKQLGNPFENKLVLGFFWKLQKPNTSRIGKVKLPPPELITPGYTFGLASNKS